VFWDSGKTTERGPLLEVAYSELERGSLERFKTDTHVKLKSSLRIEDNGAAVGCLSVLHASR
jgi:hypothetical protein